VLELFLCCVGFWVFLFFVGFVEGCFCSALCVLDLGVVVICGFEVCFDVFGDLLWVLCIEDGMVCFYGYCVVCLVVGF